MMMKKITLSVLLFLSTLSYVYSKAYTVGVEVGLQDAINYINSGLGGDTILIQSNLVISNDMPVIIKNVVVIGKNNPTITHHQNTPLFRIENCVGNYIGNISIEGTITNDGSNNGIVLNNATAVIENVKIAGADGSGGCAVAISEASNVIINNIYIHGCSIGISISAGSSAIISNAACNGNGNQGIYIDNNCYALIFNTTCAKNSNVASDGIGIKVISDNVILANLTCSENDYGIDIDDAIALSNITTTVYNSIIYDNTTSDITTTTTATIDMLSSVYGSSAGMGNVNPTNCTNADPELVYVDKYIDKGTYHTLDYAAGSSAMGLADKSLITVANLTAGMSQFIIDNVNQVFINKYLLFDQHNRPRIFVNSNANYAAGSVQPAAELTVKNDGNGAGQSLDDIIAVANGFSSQLGNEGVLPEIIFDAGIGGVGITTTGDLPPITSSMLIRGSINDYLSIHLNGNGGFLVDGDSISLAFSGLAVNNAGNTNGHGLLASGNSINLNINSCSFSDNAGSGILLNNGTGNFSSGSNVFISNTEASSNAGDGILLSSDNGSVEGSNIFISNANASSNAGDGISMQFGTNGTTPLAPFPKNNNGTLGVSTGAGNINVSQSTANGNGGKGITTSGGSGGTISSNNISDNSGGGIYIENGSNISLINNRIINNVTMYYTMGVNTDNGMFQHNDGNTSHKRTQKEHKGNTPSLLAADTDNCGIYIGSTGTNGSGEYVMNGNSVYGYKTGILIASNHNAAISNTTIAYNEIGILADEDAKACLSNMTITSNNYGVQAETGSNINIYNSIIYGNASTTVTDSKDFVNNGGTIDISNSAYFSMTNTGTVSTAGCTTNDPYLLPKKTDGTDWVYDANNLNIDSLSHFELDIASSAIGLADKSLITPASMKPIADDYYFDSLITQAYIDDIINIDQIKRTRAFFNNSYMAGAIYNIAPMDTVYIVVTTAADNEDTDAFTTLREAINTINSSNGIHYYIVTFADALSGDTIKLSGDLPAIKYSCSITGNVASTGSANGSALPTITIDGQWRGGSSGHSTLVARANHNAYFTFENLIVTGSDEFGIDIWNNGQINNVICNANKFNGIQIWGDEANAAVTVSNVTCNANGWSGISALHIERTVITNATCAGNSSFGISMLVSDEAGALDDASVLSNVTCSYNELSGISTNGRVNLYNSICSNNNSDNNNIDIYTHAGTLNVYNTVYGISGINDELALNPVINITNCSTNDPVLEAYNFAGTQIATPANGSSDWKNVAYMMPTNADIMQVADSTHFAAVRAALTAAGITDATEQDNMLYYDQLGVARRFGTGANAGKYVPGAVQAVQNLVVNSELDNTTDDTFTTLREAIAIVNANNNENLLINITFDETVFPTTGNTTITLGSNLPQITKSCAIIGNVDAQGKPTITIDGNNKQYRTFITAAGTNCTFENLIVTGSNLNGIAVGGSAAITNTTCSGNTQHGILVAGSATITNTTCAGNQYDGIVVLGSATITNTTAAGNSGIGIFVGGSATITNTTCSGNGDYGIAADGSAVITNSTCSGNSGDGIIVTGSAAATITNTTCNGNAQHGILVNGSATANVYNSISYGNGNGTTYFDLCRSNGTLNVYNTVYGTETGTITKTNCSTTNPQLQPKKADGTAWISGTDAAKDLAYYTLGRGSSAYRLADKSLVTIANLKPVSNAFFDAVITQDFADSVVNYDQLYTPRGVYADGKYAAGSIWTGVLVVTSEPFNQPGNVTELGDGDKYLLKFDRYDIDHKSDFHTYRLKARFLDDGTKAENIGHRITRGAIQGTISTIFPSPSGIASGRQFKIEVWDYTDENHPLYLGDAIGDYEKQ